jgi:uncharacterized membrane protein YkoI
MVNRQMVSLIAAGLIAAAPAAYAAGGGASAAAPPAKPTATREKAMPHLWRSEAMSGRATPARITAFGDAQVPLDKAVSIAEKAVGGRAIDVDFRHQGEWLVYRMHVLKGDALTPVTVDAMSGEILHQGRPIPLRDFDRQDHAEIAALKGASVPLAKAADAAARHAGGKAMAAALAKSGGALDYQVAVVKDGKIRKVAVNGTSGQVA